MRRSARRERIAAAGFLLALRLLQRRRRSIRPRLQQNVRVAHSRVSNVVYCRMAAIRQRRPETDGTLPLLSAARSARDTLQHLAAEARWVAYLGTAASARIRTRTLV